ncbi:Aste57867_5007 [Aphanomyces stellatus]|uniref:Aste57867_5007 protein n=1 Tax=Aphanomyces stellatus TaxID=120398 RepID=A0A485KDY1_9STRA|nr:hypothetical protein As57867_004994 [Aphanomyces stellatus]VFT82091.1 Aste57867_5007 [Aphanomyces stellatus]
MRSSPFSSPETASCLRCSSPPHRHRRSRPSETALCMLTLVAAFTVLHDLLDATTYSTQQATADVVALNTTFVQWATLNDGTNLVLSQPMVPPNASDPWTVVDWTRPCTNGSWGSAKCTWLRATGTFLVTHVSFVPFAAIAMKLPHAASQYLWLVSIYSLSCSFLPLTHPLVFESARGGSWIGRLFLFVRGLTAILVLSTSPVAFATYVTYVVNDFLLPVSKPLSSTYAPLSSVLTWLAVVVVEFSSPYKSQATIDTQCTILSFSRGVECTHGQIHIGSFERVLLLMGIAIASIAPAYLGALVVRHCAKSSYATIVLPSFHFTSASETSKRGSWFPTLASDHPHAATIEVEPATEYVATQRRSSVRVKLTPPKQRASRLQWVELVGLGYMGGAVVSSFIYLFASQAYFANDFLWRGFGDTYTNAFLANWFNVYLQLVHGPAQILLDLTTYGASTLRPTT